ncbi:MAG: hypothetical protein ABW202_23330 [Duganella sp.]
MKTPLTLIALAVLSSACTPQQKLLRHYTTLETSPASEQPSKQAPEHNIALSAFLANPKTATETPLVLDLTERAQAELVRSIAAKLPVTEGGAAALVALLSEPLPVAPTSCAWAKKRFFSKRIVFTVLGDLDKPADRIDKLDIKLELQPAPAEFLSWDRFDSIYGSYNIGSAKFTNARKFDASIGKTDTANLPDAAGGVVKLLNLGYEANKTLEESASYAVQRLSVGGALTATTARIVQEGGPNVNLFGSSSAVISLKLTNEGDPATVYAFKLKNEANTLNPAEVGIERCNSVYPQTAQDIKVNVSGSALIRKVNAGDHTVSEGDDTIQFKKVELKETSLILATQADLALQQFGLAQCAPNRGLENCQRLHIENQEDKPGSVEQILVGTAVEASALRTWLIGQSKKQTVESIGGLSIGMANYAASAMTAPVNLTGINAALASQLKVVRLRDNEGGQKSSP